MLKIENQNDSTVRNGWYLDNSGDPWFFYGGEALVILFDGGRARLAYDDFKEFEPFTRLTGTIVISNEGIE